jgi:hypothetical protein
MGTESLLKPSLEGVADIDPSDDAMPMAEAFCLTVATRCFYCFA